MSALARTGVGKWKITTPNRDMLMLNKIPGGSTEVSVMDNCPLQLQRHAALLFVNLLGVSTKPAKKCARFAAYLLVLNKLGEDERGGFGKASVRRSFRYCTALVTAT
jgi:hypothetical protein